MDDQREKDIQKICEAILDMPINGTGDYGMGGECPFCFAMCSWNASMADVVHDANCAYLIAKDLSTGLQ